MRKITTVGMAVIFDGIDGACEGAILHHAKSGKCEPIRFDHHNATGKFLYNPKSWRCEPVWLNHDDTKWAQLSCHAQSRQRGAIWFHNKLPISTEGSAHTRPYESSVAQRPTTERYRRFWQGLMKMLSGLPDIPVEERHPEIDGFIKNSKGYIDTHIAPDGIVEFAFNKNMVNFLRREGYPIDQAICRFLLFSKNYYGSGQSNPAAVNSYAGHNHVAGATERPTIWGGGWRMGSSLRGVSGRARSLQYPHIPASDPPSLMPQRCPETTSHPLFHRNPLIIGTYYRPD